MARAVCPATHDRRRMRCFSWIRTDILPDFRTDAVPAGAGYTATEIQAAYGLSATGGAGQTVAIVDAYGYTQADSDLAIYRKASGLPPCTTANGCFKIVNESGAASPLPAPNTDPDDDWRPEQSLDLDAVSAACPRCKIVLVQANSPYPDDLTAGVVAAGRLATIISNSYGQPGTGGSGGSAFTQSGHVIVASAGDGGGGSIYEGATNGPNEPCIYTYVVCAGGTELVHANNKRGWNEVVWNDLRFDDCGQNCGGTGSGCATSMPKPSWQTDTAPGDCTGRSEADVSASASTGHPFAVFNSTAGGWGGYGGTSLAAPLIAGVFGQARNATSRNGAQQLWEAKHGLNDVTSGTNIYLPVTGGCDSSVKYICTARKGYDGPTGLGTPAGTSAF